MNNDSMEVTVLMPCLDEAETLATCIDKAMRALQESGIRGEVLIADNGSVDGSQAIALAHGARLVDVTQKGYGSALRGGIESALGDFIVFADADDSYDFLQVPRFVEKLREGNDLVMGNRFLGRIHPRAMPWLHRYLGNPVLSRIGQLFFRVPIGDFHCGLRGFSKRAYQRMELHTSGMEFASEMVIKATLKGLRIAEIPTDLRPDGRSRPPHLRSFRDGWRHLRFMLLLSPRWLFLFPGLLLFSMGLVGVVALQFGTIMIGAMGFEIHTMLLFLLVLIVGGELMIFAIYTEQLAKIFGLTPVDDRRREGRRRNGRRRFSLEMGVVVGCGLASIGLGMIGWTAWQWYQQGFGPLDPSVVMRHLIPAVGCVALGVQVTFGSFFLGFLKLAGDQIRVPRMG